MRFQGPVSGTLFSTVHKKGQAGRAGQIAYTDSILSHLVMCMIQSISKSRGVMVRQGGTTGGCEERLV